MNLSHIILLAGEDTILNDQPYRYLTADDMKSLGDDSLPIDVTRDERTESALSHKNIMEVSTGKLIIEANHIELPLPRSRSTLHLVFLFVHFHLPNPVLNKAIYNLLAVPANVVLPY